MITEGNLVDVLKALHFENNSKNIYKKFFNKVDCSIEIDVEENLGTSWKITESSDKYTKKNSNVIVFKIKVPAGKTYKISYTVKY